MLKDNLAFIREAFAEFEHVGALLPTSPWAAKALTQALHIRSTPKRILELGPGSGSVTVKIIEQMIDGDELHICEISTRLMRALKNRLRKIPAYRKRKSQIIFFLGPAQEFPEKQRFDVIVCAIPFLNFELSTVKEIFDKIQRLSTRGTVLTYYEHIGIRKLSKVISPAKRRRRMRELDVFFKALSRAHPFRKSNVWLNLLPINVYKVMIADRR